MLPASSCRVPVRSSFVRIAVLAACVGVAACNSRFHADFEADAVGAPPAVSPPGPPDDAIVIGSFGGGDTSIVILVTDEPDLVPAGQPHRFMSLIHDPNPGALSIASMVSSPMTTKTQSIFVQWEQVLDGGGSGTVFFLADPTFRPREPRDPKDPKDPGLCRVTTGNDVISLECGSSAEQIEGIDTHAVHTVLMRFDRFPRRAIMQVMQGSTTTPLVAIASTDVPAPIETQSFIGQIEHQGQSGSAYRVNRFDIQERDPN